ncbi:hypothetical protein D3C73_1198910 [compost metagenome]
MARIASTPKTMAGIIGTKMSEGSTCRALAARAVGPPHGVMFITPPASMIRPAMIRGLMPRRLYRGSMAAQQIM